MQDSLAFSTIPIKVSTVLRAYDTLVSSYSHKIDEKVSSSIEYMNHDVASLDSDYSHIFTVLNGKMDEFLHRIDAQAACQWSRDEVKNITEHIKSPSEVTAADSILLKIVPGESNGRGEADLGATTLIPSLTSLTTELSSLFITPMIGYKPALRRALSHLFQDIFSALSRHGDLHRYVELVTGKTLPIHNTFQYFRAYDHIMRNQQARAAVLHALGMDETLDWPEEIWHVVGMDPQSAFFTTNDHSSNNKDVTNSHHKVDTSTVPRYLSSAMHTLASAMMARINVSYNAV
ncbi:hypothetical protein EON65_49725 [archaeon]|nr:MAG: hypothetical protein EON65_49725 [archaeon]